MYQPMEKPLRRFLAIVFGTTGLACLLGISLDLITANVAVEYFSVHHPRLLPTENPWALALFWGVAASWWFGAIAGFIVALINHRRVYPLESMRILKWTFIACIMLWLIMIGILLTVLAVTSAIPVEERRPTYHEDRRLVAVALAHQFEYVLGGIAMVIIAIKVWSFNQKPDANKLEQMPAPATGQDPNESLSPPAE